MSPTTSQAGKNEGNGGESDTEKEKNMLAFPPVYLRGIFNVKNTSIIFTYIIFTSIIFTPVIFVVWSVFLIWPGHLFRSSLRTPFRSEGARRWRADISRDTIIS